DIEALVLSGELFNGKERSSSPTRSELSHDGWHDDEIELSPEEQKYRDMGYDPDTARQYAHKEHQDAKAQQESIGMAPGRTGVKGVIRDRDEAVELEHEKRTKEMEDLRKKMVAGNLSGKTYLQEEREKAARGEDRFDELILKELERDLSKRDVFGAPRARFGYLREVGVKQFVKAVEQEVRGVWVVVHIYDPSLDRCFVLDDLLSQLAKDNPTTKFLRARASALEFAVVNKPKARSRQMKRPLRTLKEEDEFFSDDQEDKDVDNSESDDENVDLEMLPTLLVYRDGELVHNWVRVDWVAGESGVEELLRNHNIIQQSIFSRDIDIAYPDSDDADFQESLDRILHQSGARPDDDDSW
ncbi:Phosducin, partial [Leucoagaricus sp. SymC.cos]